MLNRFTKWLFINSVLIFVIISQNTQYPPASKPKGWDWLKDLIAMYNNKFDYEEYSIRLDIKSRFSTRLFTADPKYEKNKYEKSKSKMERVAHFDKYSQYLTKLQKIIDKFPYKLDCEGDTINGNLLLIISVLSSLGNLCAQRIFLLRLSETESEESCLVYEAIVAYLFLVGILQLAVLKYIMSFEKLGCVTEGLAN